MVVDGNSFLRRARAFFLELSAGRYPNASSLAELCGCSRNTAQRTIYRLRDEYLVPLEYESSEKGYYLIDKSYQLPNVLPPGKDELTALLLVRDLAATIDAEDLQLNLDSLWSQFAANNTGITRDLEPLTQVFSCDNTIIGDIADRGLLRYVFAAAAGESVEITYRSPWRENEDKIHRGRIARAHLSDGSLYLLFIRESGREMILNAAFIHDYKVLSESLPIPPTKPENSGAENWLKGFGIWAGTDLTEIELQILPPASMYYAAQRWHADQTDTWDGEVLIRKIPGIVSPEIVRRVLSLGRFVKSVKPDSLRDLVFADAWALMKALEGDKPLPKVS